MGSRVRQRGISLLELVVAISLLLLVLSLGISNLRRGETRAGTKGMAELMAEELRTARRLAMARRHPLAVAFPTNGGGNPCSRAFYHLEGEDQGVLTRVQILGSEYGNSMLFVGAWTGTETYSDPETGDVADTFDPNAWLGAGFSDQALIFMPTGRVRSSGLPVLNGNYHVLVAEDVEYTGAAAYGATGAYMITISPLGEIRVESPVPGLPELPAGSLPALATPPTMSASSNGAPRIDRFDLLPVANPNAYTANTHGVAETLMQMYPEQGNTDGMRDYSTISLRVRATDPDADQLYFRLTNSPSKGDFSVVGDANGWAPMQWDEAARDWLGSAEWLAPADAGGSGRWSFTAEVTDGQAIVNSSGFTRFVDRADGQGKITFDKRLYNDATGDWQDAIYVMNLDGTGITKVTNVPGINENNPDWSPAGARLAFNSTQGGSAGTADIWISTGDGRHRYNLTNSPAIDEQYPVFSPDGNRLVFLRDGDNDGRYGIHVQNVRQGAAVFTIAANVTTARYPASWDPEGNYVCFLGETPDGNALVIDEAVGTMSKHWRIDVRDPGGTGTITDGAGFRWDIREAHWSKRNHNGHGMIMVRADRDGDGKSGLYLVAVNPTDPYDTTDPAHNPDTDANPPFELLPESNDVRSCAWAPGGFKLAAAVDPDGNGLYQMKLIRMDYSGGVWPPAILDTIRMTVGFDTFKPRFSSGGAHIIFQSTQNLDVPYSLYRMDAADGATEMLLTTESQDVISHSVTK